VIDGLKICINISKENSDSITKKFKLTLKKDFGDEYEKRIYGMPDTFRREGKYKSWFIELYSKGGEHFLTARGSLHKFFHCNNRGKFSGTEVVSAIEGLCGLFEIDWKNHSN
jgi:hypothetical protein